jgi:transposase-like protein
MGKREEHRYFDKEFKYEAIRLMNEGNRSVKDIAGDMGIHPNQRLSVRQVFLDINEDDIANPPTQDVKRSHTPDLPCTDYRNHYLYSFRIRYK